MAAWITGGAINYAYSHINHLSFPVFSTLNQLPTSCRLRLVTRNSTGDAETAATQSISPAEVPKGPPSLISAVNVEKALRGIAITDEDHYGRLGVERGCSSDEVRVAYENKVLEMMNEVAAGLGDEEQLLLGKQLDLLKRNFIQVISMDKNCII